jgi:hypothetical protein
VAETVYVLCGLTALLCAVLLLRAYAQARVRLLLWSGICFIGLTLNNVLLFVDKVLVPSADLGPWRTALAIVALLPLLYGMIWDTE